jgi:hypothetical protein
VTDVANQPAAPAAGVLPRKPPRRSPAARLAAMAENLSAEINPPSAPPPPVDPGGHEPNMTSVTLPPSDPMDMPTAPLLSSHELPNAMEMPRRQTASPTILRSLEAQREFESRVAYDDAVADLLANLDFDTVPYQIDLIRKDPEYHPDGTHLGLGWLHTYTEPVSQKQIADKFGGGKYQLVVRVPTAPGSQKYKFFDSKTVNISGEPAIPPSRTKKAASDTNSAADAVLALAKEHTAALERQLEETKRETKEMIHSMGANNNPSLMLDVLREERKLAEARAAEARAEQQRIAADAERKHQLEMARIQMEAKERTEAARAQAEALALAAQKASAEQPKMMETMMMFMAKMDADKEKASRESTAFMMNMMQQSATNMMQQMQTAQQMQTTLLTEALRDAKSSKKGDVLEMATQFKTLKSVFGGGEPAGPSGPSWQEIAKEAITKLPDMMTAIRPASPPAPAPAPAGATRPAGPGPGAVAVLDNPPSRRPRRLTAGTPTAGALPPANGASGETPVPPKPEDNTISDYEFVTEDVPPEQALIALAKSLDLGLQRGLSSRSLYDQILLKFPPQIQAMMKLATLGQIQKELTSRVPAHWVLNSPRGHRAIEEMHEMLTTASS